MSNTIQTIKESRTQMWDEARKIADTAATHNRNLSSGEQERFDTLVKGIEQLDQRLEFITAGEKRDEDIEASFRRLAAQPQERRVPNPQDAELEKAFRSAILAKNPAPIELAPDCRGFHQPGLERRDLTKGTATQALPVSVYNRVVDHLVEQTAVLRAGATLISTSTGEDLQVPKSTAFSTAALTAEAAAITESDPTLAVVTLKAYKFAAFFQVSRELADDGNPDLLGFLGRQAAQALVAAYGPFLITGTGSGQPRGIVTDAGVGVTGPTGTATSFGAQATAGQGTDLTNDLYASLAEPYTLSPAMAFLARNATQNAVRKLKASTGEAVGSQWLAESPAPWYVDPNVAAMAANAKSVICGDMSRYFVRIAGGLRFERSDDFAFQNDLVSFRAIIRLDGALVDTNAAKVFVHSAT